MGQREGLPNITGYLNLRYDAAISVDGCFKKELGNFSNWQMSRSLNSDVFDNIIFDAAKSNPFYGSSSHVEPLNLTVKIWKRIS